MARWLVFNLCCVHAAGCSLLISPTSVGEDAAAPDLADAAVDIGATDARGPDAVVADRAAPAADAAPRARDARQQPFATSSIWNLPLGDEARLIPAGLDDIANFDIQRAILALDPSAPSTAVHYNADAWSGGSRCDTSGVVLFTAPLPAALVVRGATASDMPSNPAALLLADGRTLKQNQPFTRCVAGGDATTWVEYPDGDLYGDGIQGAQGGSGLSSLGGTIRRGEWVPGGQIRHAIKLILPRKEHLSGDSPGYRWPAPKADSGWETTYQGAVPALKMGALLALPPTLDVTDAAWLDTAPARALAWTLQNYGGYVVEGTTTLGLVGVITERSVDGDVADDFAQAWGFALDPQPAKWRADVQKIFAALHVVDSWDAATHAAVAASSGTQGAGGGAPRQPWAPPVTP